MEASEANSSEVEAQAVVWNHMTGFVNSLVLKCAVKLDIIGIIRSHGRCITLTELSAALPVPCSNLPVLRRVMRYLAHMRLVTAEVGGDDEDVSYGLTPASTFLVRGEAKSLVSLVQLRLDEGRHAPLHALDLCLDGDPAKSAYERVKGGTLFECSSRDPALNELFNDAMSCSARLVAPSMIGACRGLFERIGSLVDVGGGTGTTTKLIVEAFPLIKCTIFDLPHVVEASPVHPGIEYTAGDMFVSIPHADAVLLMRILHDWMDDDCVRILKRCREAIPEEGGTLIIVDIVIDEDAEQVFNQARLASDVLMMVYTGGKERTEKEWRDLLSKAGFNQCKITPVMALQHVIEAHP